MWMDLKIEERTMSQLAALDARKGKEIDSPLEPLEGAQYC